MKLIHLLLSNQPDNEDKQSFFELPNAEFQQQPDVGIYLVIQILEITNIFINTMAAIAPSAVLS
jgi:hypothetical protein